MKKITYSLISIFLISLAFNLVAQNEPKAPNIPIDEETKLITYKEINNEKGTKDELFDRALVCFKTMYKNSTDVLREKDKDSSKIKGVARMQIFNDNKGVKSKAGDVEYTITAEFKDGKYRLILTKFNLKQQSYFPLEKWLNQKEPRFAAKCNDYLVQLDNNIIELLKKFREGMVLKVKKEDNW